MNCSKKIIISFAGVILAVICFFLLSGCATQVNPLAEDLSLEGYFQKGMEAMDNNKYELALSYYEAAREKYPDDINGELWASYEIAFIYYKMNNQEKALELFNELIARYNQENNGYPRAPLILAEKIKAKIEAKAKRSPLLKPEPEAAT